jgi:hypothetical protein
MTDRTIAGKRYRRKIAKEFRRRINEIRRNADLRYPGCGLYLIGDAARAAGMSAQELRSIVFGTRDPDALTIGRIAHALGLKVERQFEIAVSAALDDATAPPA